MLTTISIFQLQCVHALLSFLISVISCFLFTFFYLVVDRSSLGTVNRTYMKWGSFAAVGFSYWLSHTASAVAVPQTAAHSDLLHSVYFACILAYTMLLMHMAAYKTGQDAAAASFGCSFMLAGSALLFDGISYWAMYPDLIMWNPVLTLSSLMIAAAVVYMLFRFLRLLIGQHPPGIGMIVLLSCICGAALSMFPVLTKLSFLRLNGGESAYYVAFTVELAVLLMLMKLSNAGAYRTLDQPQLPADLVDEPDSANNPDAVFRLDQLARISYLNHSMLALCGYRPDELIGQSITSIISSDQTTAALEQCYHGFTGISRSFDSKLLRKNGDRHFCRISMIPIWNNNKIIGLYMVMKLD